MNKTAFIITDYSPFGMRMSERSSNSSQYRYGFGGQEKDDEISGEGNSYTAEFWQYDPRLGRRWNVDPISYPWQSSYAAFNNNPIYFIDPLGLKGIDQETANNGGGETGDFYKDDNGNVFDKNEFGEWNIHYDGGSTFLSNAFGVLVKIFDAVSWFDSLFEREGDYSEFVEGGSTLTSPKATEIDAAAIHAPSEYQIDIELIQAIAGGVPGPKKFGEGKIKNFSKAFTKGKKSVKEAKEAIEDYKREQAIKNAKESDIINQTQIVASDLHDNDSSNIILIYTIDDGDEFFGPITKQKIVTVADKDIVNDTLRGSQYGIYDGSVKFNVK